MPQDTTLKSGVNFSVLFGGYAVSLEQAYTYAEPDSTKGFVNYQDLEPNTVGGFGDKPFFYEQYKRYLWVAPSTGVTKAYKQGLGFVNVASLIPNDTITSDMLKDGIIDGRHFMRKSGKGFAWLVNSAETGWVLADPVLNHGNGTIPVALLTGSTVTTPPETASLQFLRSNAGVVSWGTLTGTDINKALLAPIGPKLDILGIDGSQGGPGAIPQINDGFLVVWTQPGDLLKDGAVPITRLATGGVANKLKLIRVKEDGSVFEYYTPEAAAAPVVVYRESAEQPAPAKGATVTWTHGFTTKPQRVDYRFVCTIANNGYGAGDVLDPRVVTVGAGGGAEGYNVFSINWTATVVNVQHGSPTQDSRTFPAKSGAHLFVSFDPSQWNVVISASVNTITTP
jgi:hypothetical protein